MRYDWLPDHPTISMGNEDSSEVGRPSRMGVTRIKTPRTRTEVTIPPRTHTARSTGVAKDRSRNKRSSVGQSAYASLGPKCREDATPKREALTTAARKFVPIPSVAP